MHSSRMRTVRCSGRVGGVCLGGVHLTPPPPWTEFLTHACENITIVAEGKT